MAESPQTEDIYCVIGCPTDAIRMEPLSEEEWFHVPANMAEREEMRLSHLAHRSDRRV